MLVFINDIQLPGGGEKIRMGRALCQNVIPQVEGQYIPLLEPVVDLASVPVAFNVFLPDLPVHQGGGQVAEGFEQEFIQTLPRVIGADGDGFHENLLSVRCGFLAKKAYRYVPIGNNVQYITNFAWMKDLPRNSVTVAGIPRSADKRPRAALQITVFSKRF